MPIIYGDGSSSEDGRVIKVHKGAYASTNSSTSTYFNVFDTTIVPAASDSDFYIHANIRLSHTTNDSSYAQMLINDGIVNCRSGASADNGSASESHYNEGYGNSHLFNASYWDYHTFYMHQHGGSGNWNFKYRIRSQGGTTYINQAYNYDDSQRGIPQCTYIIMEMERS